MVGLCAEGGRSRACVCVGDVGSGGYWQSGILGDFWRSWPGHFKSLFIFSPSPPAFSTSHQTTTRPRPSLELTSSCFCNLRRTRTHAPAGTPPRDVGKNTRTCRKKKKKRRPLHLDADSACPQFIMHKHSVVLIISDA